MKEQALAYAQAGFPVFPVHTPELPYLGAEEYVCSCGNPNCSNVGKHPRTTQGFKAATTDLAQVDKWWSTWPEANIGMPTGTPSGLIVIDADTDAATKFILDQAIPDMLDASSGRGVHFYFLRPDNIRITNSAGKLAPGLDVRGEGGYVVLPSSLHRSGSRYQWGADSILTGVPPELPEGLAERIAAPSTSTPSGAPAEIISGERNERLISLAGAMRRWGFEQAEIAAALQEANRNRCNPPLPESEVAAIARSAARYEAVGVELNLGTPSQIRLYERDALDSLPRPKWLIQDHLVQTTISVVFGPSNVGKTFLALDMAACIATSTPFFRYADGGPFPTTEGVVVYLAAEGAFGITPRINAWEKDRGVRIPSNNFYVIPDAVQLMDTEQVSKLLGVLGETFAPPKLVVIDTLARCAAGAEENSATDMGQIIAHADAIRTYWGDDGPNVMLLHHTGKSGEQERGSTALRGAADTMLRMWRPSEGSDTAKVSCSKQKDFKPFKTQNVRLMDVQYGPHVDDASAVLVHAAEDPEEEGTAAADRMLGGL